MWKHNVDLLKTDYIPVFLKDDTKESLQNIKIQTVKPDTRKNSIYKLNNVPYSVLKKEKTYTNKFIKS